MQLIRFGISAICFVNLEAPLSIATRLINPEKRTAMPAPTNQSVSVVMSRGKQNQYALVREE